LNNIFSYFILTFNFIFNYRIFRFFRIKKNKFQKTKFTSWPDKKYFKPQPQPPTPIPNPPTPDEKIPELKLFFIRIKCPDIYPEKMKNMVVNRMLICDLLNPGNKSVKFTSFISKNCNNIDILFECTFTKNNKLVIREKWKFGKMKFWEKLENSRKSENFGRFLKIWNFLK